ncbi:MAG: hypothetical protein IPM91_19835 [Bacteroidetes bacterium]|nr:hypothetical protein [Bacteroidota bacterium]
MNGFVDFDTVSININLNVLLDSMLIYEDTLYVQVNHVAPIQIRGYFNDGRNYSITQQNGVQFFSLDTSIAEFNFPNLVHGKQVGSTTLNISYMSQSINLPILVIPEDSLSLVLSSNQDGIVDGQKNDKFLVYLTLPQTYSILQIMVRV